MKIMLEMDEIRLYNCLNGLIETIDYRIFIVPKEVQEKINAFILEQVNNFAQLRITENF